MSYFLIGILQGILEWLPVSSKGVEALIMVKFFNKTLSEALVIALWMHIGTLLAAIVYYKMEILGILKNLKNYIKNPAQDTEANRLTSFITMATLLTGLIGTPLLLFGLDKFNFAGNAAMLLIAFFLILTGVFQWTAKKKKNTEKEIIFKDSIYLGIAQGLTAIPGLSRSGTTVSTLMFRGYSAREALRVSFLVSIPAVFGVEVLLGLLKHSTFDILIIPGIIASFFFGLLTIKSLVKLAEKINFGYFCTGFGFIIILFVIISSLYNIF
ncbi:MAG: undecaprenyl-diphosphate phosphatase [Candidatus Methanoperedens sp.]|nr:undecaprenyl-diphosphate phosphatase [Candidatus Methanoperedens sp.]